jgi:hypothetical protein
MIPDIGLIVAAYTLPRLSAMLSQPSSQTNLVAKMETVVAIVVTLIALFDLFSHSNSFPQPR